LSGSSGFTQADQAMTRLQQQILGVCLLAVFVFSLVRFDGPSRGYWDTYITVPAMFMTGQPVELVRTDGAPRFDYELKGRIPDDTFDPSPKGFGISSKDQRIGAGILFAAPFAILNLAAFRWGYALCWTLLFLFAFLSLRRLYPPRGEPKDPSVPDHADFNAPLFGALLLVFNPFSLYLDRLNGNLFGLAILVFIFFLSTERRPHWWLIGLVYGLAGGVRNVAIILAPMLLAYMWWSSGGWGRLGQELQQDTSETGVPRWRTFARNLSLFTLFAFVAILPVLLWNQYAYGAMLIHPSQVPHLQGWRPTFPHSFFGSEFQFNGLLNWPFHDRLVRTPHFGYPTSMLWPLVTVQSLGVVIAALVPVGVAHLFGRHRRDTLALLYWYLAYYGLFFFQENWEELKQTFMALHLFPLAAFAGAGLLWVLDCPRLRRRWVTVGVLACAIAVAVLSARLVEAPVDERWYYRFPHAGRNDSGLTELPEERRKDWHFFYTKETAEEIERERRVLATPCPLPAFYRPFHFGSGEGSVLERVAREPFERELKTLAVWSYIYE
jgi:hypothetical protein